MNEILIKNNYVIIPNFISEERSEDLRIEFASHCEKYNISGDTQIPESHSEHNYISFLELLCEKTPEVSKILGETVLPTYAYSRIYKNGAELFPHTDRDACEISLTLHLGGDNSWPIWIETPTGEKRNVNLNPGDAMLYLGKLASHWREKYQGEIYTQVFLHYVRSRGDYSYAYFDKQNELTKSNSTTSIQKEEKIKTPDLIVNKVELNNSRNLEDYIITASNIIPSDLCDRIIKEYGNSSEWSPTSIGDGNVNTNVRNCDTIFISTEEIIHKNYQIRKKIDEDLFSCASSALGEYRKQFPNAGLEIDTGYDLLRYNEGQFYTQHTDASMRHPRAVSCSFILNDDFEGGEFAFFDRELLINCGKGEAIMFPSNFMYPHEILPVTSGTRYSIITWYV
jgi:predicted 2-oxoglutarate/Fe(II)-dependent dioxygenase YbiX